MFDVIIIGAGLAGLSAAAECEARGKSALVLEAGARVGGRVKSETQHGLTIDWGAEWIIPEMHQQVMALVERGKLKLTWDASPLSIKWTTGDSENFTTYGALKLSNPAFANALETIEQDAKKFLADGSLISEMSIRQYLNTLTTNETTSLLEEVIFPLTGGAPEFVSNHMLWHEIGYHNKSIDDTLDAKACRIEEGCDALAKILQHELKSNIRFEHSVSHISVKGDKCEVLCGGATFQSKHVICAVPLMVMDAITFDPPLPGDLQDTAKNSNAGRVAKAWGCCQSSLPLYETLNNEGGLRYGYARQIDDSHWLVCGQILVDGLGPVTKEVAADLIMKNWPSVEILSLEVTDWPREPLARASWHSCRLGWADKTKAFHTAHGSLHFAGGDIALKWAGWMEGALLSGKQVAQHVCRS